MRKFYTRFFFLLASFTFFFAAQAYSANYYVDPSYTGSSNGSLVNPWQDITTVNNEQWRFNGGDTIFFKRGSHFRGSLNIWKSGTSGAAIVFMPYGTGTAPVFEYALPDATTPINRDIIVTSNNSYLVFDEFVLTDSTINASSHTATANIGRGIYLYQSSYITLKNLDISRVGIGVTIEGSNNLVTNCSIYDLREIVNTVSPTWDDFGAVGILITGSDNSILSNHISECWSPSYDYTYDGGAMEIDGASGGNQILYNTAVNNDGWIQINTTGSSATASNNLIAYNLLINNGRVFWFNFGGTLTVQNFQFYNNDIVETVLQHSNYPYMFGCDIAPSNANALVLKNNIFWINTPIDITYTVTQPFQGAQMAHQNNLYHLSGGSAGYVIDNSETVLASGTTVFTNTSNADPYLWNYHIPVGSPAYNYGQLLGLTRDYAGSAVPVDEPEAGILETLLVPVLASPDFLFYATRKNENNLLHWQFDNDVQPDIFDIEKSEAGSIFHSIATVQPWPNPANKVYEFVDPGAGKRKAYYRIKVIFNNGKTMFSKSILLDGTATAVKRLTVFPNPVLSAATLYSDGEDFYDKIVMIIAYGGKMVHQFRVKEHGNSIAVPMDNLPAGIYYAGIRNTDGAYLYSAPLIKIKY